MSTSGEMEVIPMGLLDQQAPVNKERLIVSFIISAQLDEERLKDALDTLIRDHWRKLGARVVNPDHKGKFKYNLEYHLPKVFPKTYDLFDWSSETWDTSVEGIAPGLREPLGEGVTQVGHPFTIRDTFVPTSWPRETAQERPDCPLLLVHINRFSDATVLNLSLPHSVADILGMGNILKAWLGILDGKTPPVMVGYDEDVMPGKDGLSKYTKEQLTQPGTEKPRPFGQMALVMACMIPDFIINSEEKEHIFFFPHAVVKGLKERLHKEVEANGGDVGDITDHTIMSAIWWKFSKIHKARKPKMSLMGGAANLRGKIDALSNGKGDAFIHNGILIAATRQKVSFDTPLSEMAVHIAKGFQNTLNPANIEKFAALKRECTIRGLLPQIEEPGDAAYFVSNWCVAWKDVDFAAAVTGERPKSKVEATVIGFSGPDRPKRLDSYITSRTEKGYYVIYAGTVANMKAIEEHLANDPELKTL